MSYFPNPRTGSPRTAEPISSVTRTEPHLTRSRWRRRQEEGLLTPGEVAQLFGVHPKTIARWANSGKLTPARTLGGHRRYQADEVYALLAEQQQPS